MADKQFPASDINHDALTLMASSHGPATRSFYPPSAVLSHVEAPLALDHTGHPSRVNCEMGYT
ncbi:hypothetical protein KEM52_005335 [Ascosphaera acerosa]|nr:hypothetical protein KEM52_005335 [Ascosphaera acerosa]